MKKLKISIVTPSFNQGRFVEDTILSVLNQGYDNLEYIIIDGGSTDNTVEIIKKYEDRIHYWISEKDNGQTDAINKGFRMATGDVVAWINSDDTYCEGAFAAIAALFINNPECQWAAGNLIFMTSDGKPFQRKYPNSSTWLEKNALMSVFQPNVFLSRNILNTIGFPREDFHMTMDFEWFCRIAQSHPLQIIDKDIARFRLHPASKTTSAPNSPHQIQYQNETLSIIRQYHPKLSWLTHRFPRFAFSSWLLFVKVARLAVRVRKNQLAYLRDVIHEPA